MTTVLQRVANHLTCSRYIIGHMREDPDGGLVAFFDPHTVRHDWMGPHIHGVVKFTIDELRSLDPTQILHRVREAERDLLERLGKLRATGLSLVFILLCVYPIASGLS